MAQLQFLGATGTVTGSKYLLTANRQHILIDCGLYQGPRALRERNNVPLPLDPQSLTAVVLTHAHLDHTGYLPRLVADGFRGEAFCTEGTADLLTILLPDSAHLLTEEAEYKTRHRETPKKPLYTIDDANRALKILHAQPFGEPFPVARGVTGRFRPAGHILGAATLELRIVEDGKETVLVASGDLGRKGMLLLPDPEPVTEADVLLLESTYGDRKHPDTSADEALAAVIDETVAAGAVLLIPAFAVGRTQELLAMIQRLERAGRIPALPIHLDSPMAIEATEMLQRHTGDLRPEIRDRLNQGDSPIQTGQLSFARSAVESKALNDVAGPAIIISASGMANGGRIMHHLKQRLGDERTIVCFSGFQAEGTLGRTLLDGSEVVRIYGNEVTVRARIRNMVALSAHADLPGLIEWTRHFRVPPQTYIVHGEDEPRRHLAAHLQHLGWQARVPELGATINLPSHRLDAAADHVEQPAAAPTPQALSARQPVESPLVPERLTIGVMGSSTDDLPAFIVTKARQIGRAVALAGCNLLTGACPGIPQAAVQGAKLAGGLTVGISPALSRAEHIQRYHSPTDGYDVLIYTGSGLMGREVTNIRSSDIVIIIGGRSGTLGEFAIAYDEGKLIGVLMGSGGLADHVDTIINICDKQTGARVIFDHDAESLVARLIRMYPEHAAHLAAEQAHEPEREPIR